MFSVEYILPFEGVVFTYLSFYFMSLWVRSRELDSRLHGCLSLGAVLSIATQGLERLRPIDQ